MCPTFRVARSEAATPRAKANLLRQLLASSPEPALGSNDIREIADLCVNCKMCALECPAHVDVPRLMLEAKAAHQAEHGLDRSEWFLARVESFAALGSNFALIANTMLGNRVFRWLAERLFGVSRKRRLPAFAARTFLKRAVRKGWTRKRPRDGQAGKVAYFVDLFPNVFDPAIAEATVAVLQHHGFEVVVPPKQKACGMAALAMGNVEEARDIVRHNLRQFVELARDGYTIVCSEPTAAVMFKQDAVHLLDDADARTVSRATVELTAFLGKLHAEGRLRTDFARALDFGVGHHVPCHVKALGEGVHGPTLLSLIPRLRAHTIDESCSGMAGVHGLLAKQFDASLQAGAPMLRELARPRALYGSTECGSCRTQMEQGTGKRTLHPVQFLALAYGLMPELERRLRE
jgi:Fe-S oxidoreductase